VTLRYPSGGTAVEVVFLLRGFSAFLQGPRRPLRPHESKVLTVCLVPCQIFNAAEVLRAPWALEPSPRRCCIRFRFCLFGLTLRYSFAAAGTCVGPGTVSIGSWVHLQAIHARISHWAVAQSHSPPPQQQPGRLSVDLCDVKCGRQDSMKMVSK
jgi:hypothetical protein